MQSRAWADPIHPFQTMPDGEPIHTAQAIVDHTRQVVLLASEEVEVAIPGAGIEARPHLEAAHSALDEVLAEF
jgi:hypothetical protein